MSRFIFCALLVLGFGVGCGLIPAGTPPPPIISEPPPASAFASLAALSQSQVPPRDLRDLTIRLKGLADIPVVVSRPEEAIGDQQSFWYKNHDTNQSEEIKAQLVYRSAALNLWFQEGQQPDMAKIEAAAAILENQILPTDRTHFGTEWQPGIDGDVRFNVLHLKSIGGQVVGYFSTADEFVRAVNPFSNERELIYIGLDYAPVGSEAYYEVIAHEMQHGIHWYADSNESAWLDEGLAVLASSLNGYSDNTYDDAFAKNPDVALTHFNYAVNSGGHYGAAYSFAAYFLGRFGAEGVRQMVEQPENGPAGIEATLAALGQPMSFEALFGDWTVANYLPGRDTPTQQLPFSLPAVQPTVESRRYPAGASAGVNQFGTDYLHFHSDTPLTFAFQGSQQSHLVETAPHSGSYFWTTIPADDSDMSLTAGFDLSRLTTATLTFWTWYDIEENWDYGYLLVSADGGESWQMVTTAAMTDENPQGNSFGPAFTGRSGGGEQAIWIEQSADLSQYVGRPILIRFEYVTDDAVQMAGWAIDDIAIPELGFRDDGEGGIGGWTPAGFAHHTNILPQTFLVQRILLGQNAVQVEQLQVDENQAGQWQLPLNEQYNQVIVLISATTPITLLPAGYEWQVTK